MKTTDPPVIIQQVYPAARIEVWDAITQIDLLHQWFFEEIVSFEAVEGFKTQFNVEVEDKVFVHLWEVVKVVPQQELIVNWKYEGLAGESNVHFNLSDAPENQTKLILECEILKDFVADIPEFKRESCVAGWEYFIQGNLKEFLLSDSN